jgi:hypothetical protein
MIRSGALVCFAISLALLVMGSAARGPIREEAIDELPAELRPGSPLPSGVFCSFWFGEADDSLHCSRREYQIVYSRTRKIIWSVAVYPIPIMRAGDLVMAWGTPSGFSRNNGNYFTIYWPGRYCFIPGSIFSPNSPVSVLGWSRDNVQAEPWKGWTN